MTGRNNPLWVCDVCGDEYNDLKAHCEQNEECAQHYWIKCPVCGEPQYQMEKHWKDGEDGEECRKRLARALDERARQRREGKLDTPQTYDDMIPGLTP